MKWLNGFLLASLLITGSSGKRPPASGAGKGARLFVSHFENALGTSLELKVLAPSEKDASMAEAAAY